MLFFDILEKIEIILDQSHLCNPLTELPLDLYSSLNLLPIQHLKPIPQLLLLFLIKPQHTIRMPEKLLLRHKIQLLLINFHLRLLLINRPKTPQQTRPTFA